MELGLERMNTFGWKPWPAGDLLGDRIFPPAPQAANYSSDCFIAQAQLQIMQVQKFLAL